MRVSVERGIGLKYTWNDILRHWHLQPLCVEDVGSTRVLKESSAGFMVLHAVELGSIHDNARHTL
jgi:hypothetical protein